MKKTFVWILTLALLLSAAGARAESPDSVFETLAGLEWTFSSGAGAWSTDLVILPDGSFKGEYHDSEMGESAEEYPYGTVYRCSFFGMMVLEGQADEYAWKIRVETLQADEGQEKEEIEDGIRYVAAEPYGLSAGDGMVLYRPGTPVGMLSEEMLLWAHVLDRENPPAELDTWFLYSEKNFSGFVGYQPEEGLSANNP